MNNLGINLLTSRLISRVVQPMRSEIVPVFMLHRIADPSRGVDGHAIEDVEKALLYIKQHDYHVISIHDLVNGLIGHTRLPERAVAFTLDDGFYDQASFALPLFEKYKMPVTTFLATDMMNHRHWPWDTKLEYIINQARTNVIEFTLDQQHFKVPIKRPGDRKTVIRTVRSFLKARNLEVITAMLERLADQLQVDVPINAPPAYESITWAEAKALESDCIHFAPHSCRHIILSQLSEAEARTEIIESWTAIKNHLSNPVPVFCYPNGRYGVDFTEREQKIVQEAGLVGAFSADPGYVNLAANGQDDLYALRRFSFPTSLPMFKQYCSWLERGKDYFPGRVQKSVQ